MRFPRFLVLAKLALSLSAIEAESSFYDESADYYRNLVTACASDDDCDTSNEYCSAGECRVFGHCASNLDCLNPSNEMMIIECVGPLQCTDGKCGIECTGSFCPDEDDVECKTKPCDVTKCDEPYENCVNYSCGRCQALFIDAAGNQVCEPFSADEEVHTSCTSNIDCGDSMFCSAGKCLEFGTCKSLLDCQNPSNNYTIKKDCAGYLTCTEENLCDLTCSKSTCPDNTPKVSCLAAPCKSTNCTVPHEHCVDDYCGGCNAIFINATGEQVCGVWEADLCKASECHGNMFNRFGCSASNLLWSYLLCPSH